MTPFPPALGIALLLNNYVHDVATGLLLISALWIGWSAAALPAQPSPETVAYFRVLYRRGVRFAVGSIAVIVVTGIVRTVTFMDFEWQAALGKGLIPILILKHVLIFTMLGAGIYAWVRLRARMRELK
jgi:putative copper export protein